MANSAYNWVAPALGIVAAAILSSGVYLSAARRPDYRHHRDTISELGEIGAKDAHRVAWLLFAPVGAFFLAAATLNGLAEPSSWPALAIAVGYLAAAAFPCDPGSPLSGSARQSVHNFCGGIEYIGGGLALLTLDGEDLSQTTGILALITAAALSVPFVSAWRGLIQRIGETALFVGAISALAA